MGCEWPLERSRYGANRQSLATANGVAAPLTGMAGGHRRSLDLERSHAFASTAPPPHHPHV